MQPFRFARRLDTAAAPAVRAVDTCANAQRDVSSWITNPLTAVAFVPRLYAGTIAKGPNVVSEIAGSINDANTALQSSTLTTAEKRVTAQDMIASILNKQLDALLVRGTQLEIEVLDRVDAVIDTSLIRPAFPQPLEQPEEITQPAADFSLQREDDEDVDMPTEQSRSASALLQLQDAIASIQAALTEIESNETPSRVAMLKLTMREAWDTLRMRVEELESTPVDGVETALHEAKGLVEEVQDAFSFT